ncbi:MAG: D-alanyl-D-alanine carboxypeptidase [Cyclobacteriaceae bacterium]
MTNMVKSNFDVFAIFCVFTFGLSACGPIKKITTSRDIDRNFKHSEVFSSQFTGFVLFDPATEEYLKAYNADRFFTPASNTKILTTLACLTNLNDSIPSFLISDNPDTLQLTPLGDPTFLHIDFPYQPVINCLKEKPISIFVPDQEITPFGPGWAWDDYQFSFQSERSWMPIYGNEVRIFNSDTLHIIPDFFADYVNMYVGEKPGSLIYRDLRYNLFNIWMEYDTSTFERKIPFNYSDELLATLLSDTTKASVSIHKSSVNIGVDTLYNQATLPVLAIMMQRSDNFLAEQLLIVAASASGYTDQATFRKIQLAKWGISNDVQWVDGSGLSRYNLFSPRAIVKVLSKIYEVQSWENIGYLFPTGGVSGTIKNWYLGENPYVFAKTGTLSNNHCLSGFIETSSGRRLIFSFMNNNYLTPVSEVKAEMQKVLEAIRKAY